MEPNPTAGAMRASLAIFGHEPPHEATVLRNAIMIDRESGLVDLLAAARVLSALTKYTDAININGVLEVRRADGQSVGQIEIRQIRHAQKAVAKVQGR